MSRKPNFSGMGMDNIQGSIRRAEKMQQQTEVEQVNLAAQEFVSKSADDMVIAASSGDRQLKDLKIGGEAIDPDNPDMLQNLVIDTVNKGTKVVDDVTQASIGKYTKGLM